MTVHHYHGTTRDPVYAKPLASDIAKQAAATTGENPKDRHGKVKPSMHFVPMIARLQEAIVMALGAHKYGSYNWREKKVLASVYSDAIERHLAMWMDGAETDEESGVSHLAHVRACCAILLDAQITGNMVDDRPKTGGAISAFIRNFTKETPP